MFKNKKNPIQWISRCEQMPKDQETILAYTESGYVIACQFDAKKYEYFYNKEEGKVQYSFCNIKYWSSIPENTKLWKDRLDGDEPADGQLIVTRAWGILVGRYNKDKYEIHIDLEGEEHTEWFYSTMWWLAIPEVLQS